MNITEQTVTPSKAIGLVDFELFDDTYTHELNEHWFEKRE